MIFLFSDLKFSWWPVRSSLLDLTGKKSNSVIAVTRDKVIVFSVGVGGEICGDDLVNITGTGENWGGETSWRWYTQCDKHVFLLSPCPSGAVVQLVDSSLLHLVLKDDQASLQPTFVQFPALCSPFIWTVHCVLGQQGAGQQHHVLAIRGHRVLVVTCAYGDRLGVRYMTNMLKLFYLPIIPFYKSVLPTIVCSLPY